MSEVSAPVCRECGQPSPEGDPCETCAEVERILSMTDDEIIAQSSDEELGWARGFKEGLGVGLRALATNRAQERAAIVAYLDEIEGDPELQVYAAIFANRIQRGDHLNRKEGGGI